MRNTERVTTVGGNATVSATTIQAVPKPARKNWLRSIALHAIAWVALSVSFVAGQTTSAATSPVSEPVGSSGRAPVDASTIRGRVMCGYQGWFRCPGDPSGSGWVHWSRDGHVLSPGSLTFEMWPDVSGLSVASQYPVPGFTQPDGGIAHLFSSDDLSVVRSHFQQMRDYGIDGAWLQHFVVDLPGGPFQDRFASRHRVLGYVAQAAQETGRAWALSFDTADAPPDKIFDLLTTEWKRLVDERTTASDRYLHERGLPVVQVFGFYWHNAHNPMSATLGRRLIAFFHTPGPYKAYFVGGGDWDWRQVDDEGWRANYAQMDAYVPWNIGNISRDARGVAHASIAMWEADRATFEHDGHLWIPSIYPGFSWDNLQQKPPGSTNIPRRGGAFYWEQFVALARLNQTSAFVAMFDEVDEATAIFKVTSDPPKEGHFVGLEGQPSDTYLQLTGAGTRMLRGEMPMTDKPPLVTAVNDSRDAPRVR